MQFQNIPSSPATCSSETAQPGAVAAPERPAPTPTNPLIEIRGRRRWEQVHDVDGSLWEVREARATKHGFDLLFGYRANSDLGGRTTLIPTPPLIDYWEAHCAEASAIYDLPAGLWHLKRLRRQYGFNFCNDRRALWKTRVDDLKNLSMHEFARRHNVHFRVAEEWRLRLVGPVPRRRAYWWKDPAVLQILRARLTNRETAEKLGISVHQARCLRHRALAPDDEFTSCRHRPLPNRWRTPFALEILRSNLPPAEVAERLGVSLAYAQSLRKFLSNDTPLAA